MITAIIDAIGDVASGVMDVLVQLFTSAVGIFYNTTDNQLTFLGVCLIFVVAVPLAYWVINFVISMVRKIRTTRGK